MDFLTAEVWTPRGLETQHVLFAIDLESRRVEIAGITSHPTEAFMAQTARNLTDPFDGFLRDHRMLIIDQDSKFAPTFTTTLTAAGIKVVRTPYRAPNCNAFAERFVLSIKSECLDRMIFFGERRFRSAVKAYIEHYNAERPHQGIGNRPIPGEISPGFGRVHCRERLGGLINHYYGGAK
jgi:transposase InsO family protein